jgi:uncharacterized protein DUF3768
MRATAHSTMTMENDMDMLSLVEAARKTSLTTLAKAIRTGRLSTRRKEDGSYETDPVFFKIDYFDQLSMHLSDPGDASVTQRVITIMLAEEY